MKHQELVISREIITAVRDVSSPERNQGVGSPPPARREGLRSSSCTPSSGGKTRTGFGNSHNHGGSAPGSDEHLQKRGRRGDAAGRKDAGIELSVVLSGEMPSCMGTDAGRRSGTRLRRPLRRLSFDKELDVSKSPGSNDLAKQDVVATSRSKRKDMGSPRGEPEPKASRGEQNGIAVENVQIARLSRKGNAVAEPSTPPTGEDAKKSLENEDAEAEGEQRCENIGQCQMIEEPSKTNAGASGEGKSGTLGKRPRGRPRKSTTEQKNSTTPEISAAEDIPDTQGGSRRNQVEGSNAKTSGDPPVLTGVANVEDILPSLPVEAIEKSVEALETAVDINSQSGADVEDNVGNAVPESTSPTADATPKRSFGRPKKLPVVSLKGRKSAASDPSTTEIHVHVDVTVATASVVTETVEKSGKRSRGRPKKLQNSLTQENDVSVTENRMTTVDVSENSLKAHGSILLETTSRTTDLARNSIPTPPRAPPSSERTNREDVLRVDPFPSVLRDSVEAYPGKTPRHAQPSAAVNDESEKDSACFTPDPAEKALKRRRGRPKKVKIVEAELKKDAETAEENARSEIVGGIESLPGADDNAASDGLSKISVMDGSSAEIAARDLVGPLEPAQNLNPRRDSQGDESDAKGEEEIDEPFASSSHGTDKAIKKRPGRPRKAKDEISGRRPVGRPRKTPNERNADVSVLRHRGNRGSMKRILEDEKLVPSRRSNLRSMDVTHGRGSQVNNEEVSRKRGRKKKATFQPNSLRRKRKEAVGLRRPADGQSTGAVKGRKGTSAQGTSRRRYVSKVVLDGVEFRVGDDVYVRKDGFTCSESETEVEECQVCGKADGGTMIECDKCLDGFHLTCLDPPLEEVPEDEWVCPYCTSGSKPPVKLQNQRRKHRSAREMLLAAELWAARIEKIWSEQDGTYWFKAGWFLIPEETSAGRQKHTGSRELFRSSQTDDNEMDSIVRHCYVMSPNEYKKCAHEGDDVFYCEYEYSERWCRFKRIDYDSHSLPNEGSDDEAYSPSDESEEELEGDEDRSRQSELEKKFKQGKSPKAANKRQSFSRGIEQVGAKNIVDRPKKGPQSDFEKARAALTLSAVPPSMPCRELERAEIAAFLRDSVGAGEQCLGHCLYISGVPGTGKTATVREVIKDLETKVDAGELPAFRFVEINGLRLASPDHVYTVLYEAFTGQHLGWKKALECLDDRFSSSKHLKGADARPCVLLVDELDVLVNRNQSVLYNIFDWPSRPHSRLVVIGIANTMDLPERMLPRIASRLGMKRISFSPYTHKQLEEIIASRLEGVRIFDKQAAEFASRKVAAVSGDIRRALELCRRAVEVAEARIAERKSTSSPENPESLTDQVPEETQTIPRLVTMADVDAAISQLFEAPQIQMMQRSSKLAKIFLTAMVCEQKRTSTVETTFEKVQAVCSELCANNAEDIPDPDTLLDVGCKLGGLRLLLCESGALHKHQKLQLNFPCDDVSFALKKDSGLPWLSKYL